MASANPSSSSVTGVHRRHHRGTECLGGRFSLHGTIIKIQEGKVGIDYSFPKAWCSDCRPNTHEIFYFPNKSKGISHLALGDLVIFRFSWAYDQGGKKKVYRAFDVEVKEKGNTGGGGGGGSSSFRKFDESWVADAIYVGPSESNPNQLEFTFVKKSDRLKAFTSDFVDVEGFSKKWSSRSLAATIPLGSSCRVLVTKLRGGLRWTVTRLSNNSVSVALGCLFNMIDSCVDMSEAKVSAIPMTADRLRSKPELS